MRVIHALLNVLNTMPEQLTNSVDKSNEMNGISYACIHVNRSASDLSTESQQG
jgi:hypothetical protein